LAALTLPRPSRAYYLTYLVFGYTAASLFVNRFYELSIQDMIAIVVPIGTFVGAFLFYLRPELALLLINDEFARYVEAMQSRLLQHPQGEAKSPLA